MLKDGTVKIKKYTGEEKKVIIPAVLGGKPVSKIGNAAFACNQKLRSADVPEGVTEIGQQAFYATRIKAVSLPSTLEKVSWEAFRECTRLSEIVLPSRVKDIDDYAFFGCKALTLIRFSNKVQHIGERAFLDTGYENDGNNWENGVLYLNRFLIYCKEDIARVFQVKSGTVVFADKALERCYSTEVLWLPKSVRYFSATLLKNCVALNEIRVEEKNKHFSSMAGVLFNENKTALLCYPQACAQLESVKLGNGVRKIGMYAFYNCPKLRYVFVPRKVKSIGYAAFGMLKDDDSSVKDERFLLYGYKGSEAEAYCQRSAQNDPNRTVLFKAVDLKTPRAEVKGGTGKLTVTCRKVKKSEGFQIKAVCGKRKIVKTVKSKATVKKTLSAMKPGRWSVKVRAWYSLDGTRIYSRWTKPQTVTVK